MQHLFLDTNILLDLLANRVPFNKHAIALFKGVEQQKYTLYTSSHSIATCYYLLQKHGPEKKLRETIQHLLDYLSVLSVDERIIKKSLKSPHKDFEDAIQMNCAYSNPSINFIITRNTRDFKLAELEVLTAEEFLNR